MNQLPVEVCEEIFKNLNLQGVLSARRTCRRWRQIVDGSPALMSRIHLKPPLSLMDRSCKPICSIPARGVTLKDTTVLTIDSWWKSIGPELTFLRLENCVISTETLVALLRKTPNLKYLSYACDNDVAETESDFTLDKLEQLEVYSAQTQILDIFDRICPRLKQFRFGQSQNDRKLGEFLQKKKSSLEIVQLISVENILADVLQLKALTSLDVQADTFGNETLEQIGAALPTLSNLRVTLQWQPSTLSPTFLNLMPELKSLTIFGQYRQNSPILAEFGNLEGLTKLKKLHLTQVKPSNLKEFLQKSDHFCDLTLHYCHFNDWSEIFTLFASLQSLERLDFGKIRTPTADIIVSDFFRTLKYLKIAHCYLSLETLKSFTEHCENLMEVDFNFKYILDGEIVRSLCRTWKKSENVDISKLYEH
uniref:(northern house mosquito) hypothetical protein n=1 Tax=Culex pipiens TaxID=7175 RepID=A0A8D8F1I5_CULPI